MMRVLATVAFLGISFGVFSQCPNGFLDNPNNCCQDCTCTLCGYQICCESGPLGPDNCNAGGTNACGIGTGTTCTTWWQNTSLTGTDRGDGASTDCIPIDGGLGFLIAGGLGIGVIGIRRRKDEIVKAA